MGRKSSIVVGQKYGGLLVKEVLASRGSGTHAMVVCLCTFCKKETTIKSLHLKKRASCGCQQHNSKEWKRVGPKSIPWRLASGRSARNGVLAAYKRGAKKRNISFTLNETVFDALIVGPCRYCGSIKTQCQKGQGKTSGDFLYTGIDRIDSSLGYTEENCVSCCWVCNDMKKNRTLEEFLLHIRKIYKHNL